jgi:uncharacterized protein YtpQ (UPF0354 family)
MHPLISLCLLVSFWLTPVKVLTSSEQVFTESVKTILKSELDKRGATNITLKIDAPLSIRLQNAHGFDSALSVARLWAICEKDSKSCQESSLGYISRAADQLAMEIKGEPPPSVGQLRILVRDLKYVNEMKKSQPDLIAQSLGGELWAVLVLDFPSSSRPLRHDDLDALKLDEGKARIAAVANVTKEVGPLKKLVQALPKQGIGYLTPPGYYNAGLLVSTSEWAPIAKTMRGRLLVSVPTDQLVLYIDSAQPDGLVALQAITQQMFDKADRPVSRQILQWEEKGWKALK